MNVDAKHLPILRELFICREDVIPYSPPQGGWSQMKEQGNGRSEVFTRYSDMHMLRHLSGVARIGAYSTLPGASTCKWVVADVDSNSNAFEQSLKIKKSFDKYNVPSFIERSNSGKGYHVWVFFSEPVPAKLARTVMNNAIMTSGIPTKGMFSKHKETIKALDKIIPSQDYVPEGGFGNLVSLPFFGKSAQSGNTVFLTDEGKPHADQSALLEDIYSNHRVSPEHAGVIELLSITGFDHKEASNEPAYEKGDVKSFMSIHGDLDVEKRLDEIRGCTAIKMGIANANSFSEPAWQAVISNLAVYGEPARALTHEFSSTYSLGMTGYDPEETDRKFESKLRYSNRPDSSPYSCRSLSDSAGWPCPNLNSCNYKFIAHYGLDPSYILLGASEEDKRVLYKLEQEGLYDFFLNKLYTYPGYQVYSKNKSAWVNATKYDTLISKSSPKSFDNFALAKHLFVEPVAISMIDISTNMTSFLMCRPVSKKSLSRFIKELKSRGAIYYVDKESELDNSPHRVWIFFSKPVRIESAVKFGREVSAAAKANSIGVQLDTYINSGGVSSFINPYVVAPFSKRDGKRGPRFLSYLINKFK